jgi:hypothetical protein
MKLSSSWIFSFCIYYTLMDIFNFLLSHEERMITGKLIQSFIFSTLLVIFFWLRKNKKTNINTRK